MALLYGYAHCERARLCCLPTPSEAYEWLEDAQQLVVAVLHVASDAGDETVIRLLVAQQVR